METIPRNKRIPAKVSLPDADRLGIELWKLEDDCTKVLHIAPDEESVMNVFRAGCAFAEEGPVVACGWNPTEGMIMKSFDELSLMEVAIDNKHPAVYEELTGFFNKVNNMMENEGSIIYVWYGSDARSVLTKLMIAAKAEEFLRSKGHLPEIVGMDCIPAGFDKHNPNVLPDEEDGECRVYRLSEIPRIVKVSKHPWSKSGIAKMARKWRQLAGKSEIIRMVDKQGDVYGAEYGFLAGTSLYLMSEANHFECGLKELYDAIRAFHPQVPEPFAREWILKQIDIDLYRTDVPFDREDPENWDGVRIHLKYRDQDIYYKWRSLSFRALQSFAYHSGYKLNISKEDFEKERELSIEQAEREWEELQAEWNSPERERLKKEREKARFISWASVPGYEDWEWSYMLEIWKEKLHWMAGYFRDFGHGADDRYLAEQMKVAEHLCGIVLKEGKGEGIDWDNPERWKAEYPYVNMRNASRFEPVGEHSGSVHFYSEEQKLRFYKAYHLLFKYLKEKMLYWWD